jgi:hypothetical protein
MRTHYPKLKDGTPVEVPFDRVLRVACCECALVHDVRFRKREGGVVFRAKRNVRATAALRREGWATRP